MNTYDNYLEFWEHHSFAAQVQFFVFVCVWLNEILRSVA